MPLLVSFCNQALTPSLALLLLDQNDIPNSTWLDYPAGIDSQYYGCTGIEKSNDKYYVLTQSPTGATDLLVFDHALTYLATSSLPPVKHAHSLVAHDSNLYVVSSGDNSVYRLRLSANGLEVRDISLFWRPPEFRHVEKDVIHLNSIAEVGGQLLITYFGEKAGNSWKSALRGACYNVTTGQLVAADLPQPHTLRFIDGAVYLFTSADGAIWRSELTSVPPLRRVELGGYLRGLASNGGELFVGRSAARTVSRSMGTLNANGDLRLNSAILILGSQLDIVREIDMSLFGPEVYDIQYVSTVPPRTGKAIEKRIATLEENLLKCHYTKIHQLEIEIRKNEREITALRNSPCFKIGRVVRQLSMVLRRHRRQSN